MSLYLDAALRVGGIEEKEEEESFIDVSKCIILVLVVMAATVGQNNQLEWQEQYLAASFASPFCGCD